MKMDKGVTLIAAGTEMIGEVRFDNQLYVSGRVQGDVVATAANATLIVSEQGVICGEVRVPHLVINGLVEGEVYAARKVELAAKGRVRGNLHYNLIEMELGATVEGHLIHDEELPVPSNVHSIAPDRAGPRRAEGDG